MNSSGALRSGATRPAAPGAIVKLIRVFVRPGCREEFLRQQRVWNDAMARQEGFLGVHVCTDPEAPDEVLISVTMKSREALARFMEGDHDAVAAETRMAELYERLEVRVLDVVSCG